MCADYKYCALARLPSDGRAAPRRQSYNYEYCALARLPPDDRATIKTNNAHARLPPDDRAAPRRPGLLHCAHTKGAMHQIIISSNLRRDTLQAQGWHSGVVADGVQLPGVPASGDGARHGRPRGRCSDPPKSDSCDHCPGPPPLARLGRLARCENGRPHVCLILWRHFSRGDKIWTCSPCLAATLRDTRSDTQTA